MAGTDDAAGSASGAASGAISTTSTAAICRLQAGLLYSLFPRPGVATPDGGQQVQTGALGPTGGDGEAYQDVIWICFGILDKNIKIAVFVENTRVYQLVLELLPRPAPVCFQQIAIRERLLGVLIEVLHVRVCRCGVEVEIIFFDI